MARDCFIRLRSISSPSRSRLMFSSSSVRRRSRTCFFFFKRWGGDKGGKGVIVFVCRGWWGGGACLVGPHPHPKHLLVRHHRVTHPPHSLTPPPLPPDPRREGLRDVPPGGAPPSRGRSGGRGRTPWSCCAAGRTCGPAVQHRGVEIGGVSSVVRDGGVDAGQGRGWKQR